MLADRKVWVTRPARQSQNLCQLIDTAGGKAIPFPVIEIIAVTADENTDDCDVVIFVSRNAVLYAANVVLEIFEKLNTCMVIAIGQGTRQELVSKGLTDIVSTETGVGSEALLTLDALQEDVVRGKQVAIIRGQGGRNLLKETLQRRGAEVKYIEVYSRGKPSYAPHVVKQMWQDTPPDVIVVTSVEGLHNLIQISGETLKERLLQTLLVVISDRLQASAVTAGFTQLPLVSPDASDEGILQALKQAFED